MTTRPESVMLARDPEVLQLLLNFYASPGAKVLDVTANKRRMWEGVSWSGPIKYSDIDPEQQPDFVADFRDLPFSKESVDVLVFDPPHLPQAAASPASHEQMVEDYGLAKSVHGDNVSSFFKPFLVEAHRVLAQDGLIFAKLKDFVHNHKYQWTLTDFINEVKQVAGLTPCDLIVKRDPCGGNLKSSKWKNSYHSRCCHTWWVVVRKGRCEPRGH